MNTHAREVLWNQLSAKGLVQGELPGQAHLAQAWYIRAMLMAAGWLGALFLFSFVGALFAIVMQSGVAALLFGAGILAGARWLMKWPEGGDFAEQFALAAALAGQTLCIFGLFDVLPGSGVTRWLLIAAFEVALIVWMPSYLHRAFCTLAAVVALSIALHDLRGATASTAIVATAFAAVWMHEESWAGVRGTPWEPVGVGLALALALWDVPQLLVGSLGSWSNAWAAQGILWQAGKVAQWLIALVLCAKLLRRTGLMADSSAFRVVMVCVAMLGALTWFASGLVPALMVLAVGFSSGHRFLFGLGLLALAGFLSGYYYTLQETLLFKSVVLTVTGVVLLVARSLMRKFTQAGDHA